MLWTIGHSISLKGVYFYWLYLFEKKNGLKYSYTPNESKP